MAEEVALAKLEKAAQQAEKQMRGRTHRPPPSPDTAAMERNISEEMAEAEMEENEWSPERRAAMRAAFKASDMGVAAKASMAPLQASFLVRWRIGTGVGGR